MKVWVCFLFYFVLFLFLVLISSYYSRSIARIILLAVVVRSYGHSLNSLRLSFFVCKRKTVPANIPQSRAHGRYKWIYIWKTLDTVPGTWKVLNPLTQIWGHVYKTHAKGKTHLSYREESCPISHREMKQYWRKGMAKAGKWTISQKPLKATLTISGDH